MSTEHPGVAMARNYYESPPIVKVRQCPGIGSCPICQSHANGAAYDGSSFSHQSSGAGMMPSHMMSPDMIPQHMMSSNTYMTSMPPRTQVVQNNSQYSRVLLNPPTSACFKPSAAMNMTAYSNPTSSSSSFHTGCGCTNAQFVLESAQSAY